MSEQPPILNQHEWQPGGRFSELYNSATSYTYPSRVAQMVKQRAAAFAPLDWLDKKCVDIGLSSMKALDDTLDKEIPHDSTMPDVPDDPNERLEFFSHCTDLLALPQTPITREGPPWVRPFVWDNVELLRELLQVRAPEDRQRVIDAIRGVGWLSVQKAGTFELGKYRDLLVEEGQLVAHWVLGPLGHSRRSADHVLLNEWAENIGVAGVLVMGAGRLPESNEAGRAGLAATRANRIGLFSAAFPYFLTARAQYKTALAKRGR